MLPTWVSFALPVTVEVSKASHEQQSPRFVAQKGIDKDRYETIDDLDGMVDAVFDAVDAYSQEKPELFKAGTDYLTKSLGFADDDFRARHPFAALTRDAFSKYGHLVRRT